MIVHCVRAMSIYVNHCACYVVDNDNKMDVQLLKPCACSDCCGQLVSRSTFYRHNRRITLGKEVVTEQNSTISDPFDADISSSEEDTIGTESFVCLIDVACGHCHGSGDQPEISNTPPLKSARFSDSVEVRLL